MTATPAITLSIYCVLILLASLVGGWIPIFVKLTHKRMEIAISFVAGVMLGVGVLHMLPHAVMARFEAEQAERGAVSIGHETMHQLMSPLLLWLIGGFLAMFFIERFFRFHHHDAPGHDHAAHSHQHQHSHRHGMTWAGAAVGLSLHSLIEGIALAASVAVLSEGGEASIAGLATFLVIFLHKPFDAMTIGTLMSANGRSAASRHVINVVFSLLIPLGVVLFFAGLGNAESRSFVVAIALAFSAGTFLCIALSDLLPELQFHHHDRGKLSAALILGLALAWGLSELERTIHVETAAGHEHSHDDPDHIH